MTKQNEATAAEQLRYLILAAERQGGRMFQEALKPTGITGSQAEVLRVLEEREPLSLKELGSLLICETGSPSRLVDRLVREGFVIRETDPKDSRYVLLSLSAAGRDKARQVADIERGIYSMITEKISAEEIEKINSFIYELLSGEPVSEALRARGFIGNKVLEK